MARITPEVLQKLRKLRGWTLDQLAEKSRVDKQTIHRLEHGRRGQTRQTTIKKLAEALRVDPESLTQPAPDEQAPIAAWGPNRSQLNLRISDQARNALLLVSERYHVKPTQLVELAPLLFNWVAETCLQRRRERIETLKHRQARIVGELEDFASDAGDLDPNGPPWDAVDVAKFDEEFDQFCIDKDFAMSRRYLFDEYGLGGPIDDFLTKLVSDLGDDSEFGGWRPGSSPTYTICKEEAAWLANGDEVALENILQGYVPLHDLPNDFWEQLRTRDHHSLWEPDGAEATRQRQAAERVDWLRAHGRPVTDGVSEDAS